MFERHVRRVTVLYQSFLTLILTQTFQECCSRIQVKPKVPFPIRVRVRVTVRVRGVAVGYQ